MFITLIHRDLMRMVNPIYTSKLNFGIFFLQIEWDQEHKDFINLVIVIAHNAKFNLEYIDVLDRFKLHMLFYLEILKAL